MATGLTFWQMPEEQGRFLDYVAGTGDVLGISNFEALPSRKDLRALPLAGFAGSGDIKRLHIFPAQFADDIEIHEFPPSAQHARPLYSVDTMRSPVLMYTPGKLVDGALSQANLSTCWTCLDKTGRVIVEKPAAFRQWGERVFRWLRRMTPEWFGCRGYRCTRIAATHAQNGLQLVLYHGWTGEHTGEGSFEVMRC
jgi:hypothetical protein